MIRKLLAAFIGSAQVLIGALSIVFTYVLNYDLYGVRAMFGITVENVGLSILLLWFFGVFSIISGLSFVQEWRSLK